MLSRFLLILPPVLAITASTFGGAGSVTPEIEVVPEVAPVPALEINDRGLGDKYQRIHVKIFPHDRAYLPHRRDSERQTVAISSAGTCRFYTGTSRRPGRTKQILFKAQTYQFDAATLSEPMWVECTKPVTLERAPSLPSYEYKGHLYVRTVDTETGPELLVVNIVDLETYLRGVVPSEVYPHWAEDTLKAQAVAARTYAVFHMALARRVERKAFYDVDDTIVYQAYTGISQVHGRTDAAIAATTGEIITYNDQVIPAYYHADSGGHTEDAHAAFGMQVPYVRSQAEIAVAKDSSRGWSKTYTHLELNQKFRSAGMLKPTQKLAKIRIAPEALTASKRVRHVYLELDDGSDVYVSMRDLNKLLGLKSYLFTVTHEFVTPRQQTFTFSGRGFGHGVGLNQSGAQALASEAGWSYLDILRFYYQDIEICHMQRCGKGSNVAATH